MSVHRLRWYWERSWWSTSGVATRIPSAPLAGVAARAVVVLDENDQVLHAELVAEIKDEPNYEAALKVLA